ncbi:MAG: tail fiber domain-containing protein, partial [Gammaproteobacteria bacterium]|nr:tail fiber domain-containing protein [Gammaproteobacteria bacterium]
PLANIPATLTGKDADTVDGAHAGTAANNVLKLDASALVPLAQIPAALAGKSADMVDGYHVGTTAGTIPYYDASGDLTINTVRVGKGAGAIITNTVVGSGALGAITTGDECTAVGRNALAVNTTGFRGTAIGTGALSANTTGPANTAVGWNALAINSTGSSNVAVGGGALGANTTGGYNVAVGTSAAGSTFGSNNTIVGYDAGGTGDNHTALGYTAGKSQGGANTTCLGYNAQSSTTTISNQITLGNASITSLRCAVTTITALSDARDKADITDIGIGTDFISRLRPVKFKWHTRDGARVTDEFEPGFIAQELRTAQEDAGAPWMGLVLEDNPDKLEATPGKLIPVIVRAIQELNLRLSALEAM